jgi:hypothetical protein
LTVSPEAAIAYRRDLQAVCFAAEDAVEGRAAVTEMRRRCFAAAEETPEHDRPRLHRR